MGDYDSGDDGALTWSAVMPLLNAFRTLSRVNIPTTKLGNRYFMVTNRFSTAVCNGLSRDL